MSHVLGRDEVVRDLLAVLRADGPAGARLVGAPGMGKTALLDALLASGEISGHVLRARPLESEADLAHSGLTDLLADLDPTTYDALPGPQRRALRAALLLDEAAGPADPRALAAGVRSVLAILATRAAPVVLVVDDAHWLDEASARVLAQALARSAAGQVRMVLAQRPTPRDVVGWLGLPAGLEVALEPLPMQVLFAIVQRETGVVLDRGQLRRLAEESAGNPMHALALVRAGGADGAATGSFEQLLDAQVDALPRATRSALLAAALDSKSPLGDVARVAGTDVATLADRLEPAVVAGLVRLGPRVTFTHPLHLRAVVDRASAAELAELHSRWAEVVPDDVAAVRHLALSSGVPDPDLAERLVGAAHVLRGRAAWDAAADLLELAIARTPGEDPELAVRALTLGGWLHQSGRPAEAEKWLLLAREVGQGELRWRATLVHCEALMYQDRRDDALPMVQELLAADLPPQLACDVRFRLARDLPGTRPEQAHALMVEVNRQLATLPDAPGLTRLRGEALTEEARLCAWIGEPAEHLLTEALAHEAQEPPPLLITSARLLRAIRDACANRSAEARAVFDELLQACRDSGDEFSQPYLLFYSALTDFRGGAWDAALSQVDEARAMAQGQAQRFVPLIDMLAHTIGGHRDGVEAARAWLSDPPDLPAMQRAPLQVAMLRARGSIELAHERYDEAWAALSQAAELQAMMQWRDPGDLIMASDFAEAAIAVGRVDDAGAALDEADARAAHMGRLETVPAHCARARVLLAVARDDLDGAVAAIPGMLAGFERGPASRLDHGRAHLTAGRVLRRALRKSQAAAELTEAVRVFDDLGCPPYAAQARAELARVGLRPRAGDGLTPTEEQVARLAAAGLRNTEIAERAFLSTKTVEGVLSRCYRKLGVRGRAQLAEALARLPQGE